MEGQAPETPPGPVGLAGWVEEGTEGPKSEDRYDTLLRHLQLAAKLVRIYKRIGVKPCDLGQTHRIIRAWFGY